MKLLTKNFNGSQGSICSFNKQKIRHCHGLMLSFIYIYIYIYINYKLNLLDYNPEKVEHATF